MRNMLSFNWCSPIYVTRHFSLTSFKIFPLILGEIMMCLGIDFFVYILFVVSSVYWISRFVFFTKFSMLSAITLFLQILSGLSPFSFWDSDDTLLGILLYFQRSLRPCFCFFFQSRFSLLFSLGEFYWSVFKFTDSNPHHFSSTVEPIHFGYWFFQYYNLPLVPFYNIYFFPFFPREFVIVCWGTFTMIALKSLADNSNIWFILVLV